MVQEEGAVCTREQRGAGSEASSRMRPWAGAVVSGTERSVGVRQLQEALCAGLG